MCDIKVLLMNAGLDKSDKGNRKLCQQALSSIFRVHTPHLAIIQEFSCPQDDHWKNKVIGRYYAEICSDNAIIYRRKYLSRTIMESKIFAELSSSNPLRKTSIKKLNTVREPVFEFICVCWHGPWRQLYPLKCDKDQNERKAGENAVEFSYGTVKAKLKYGRGTLSCKDKKDFFEYFMAVMSAFRREQEDIPILIGGDFNIPVEFVQNLVNSPFKVCTNKSRRGKRVIDFFIITEELEMTGIKCLDLNIDTVVSKGNPLDREQLLVPSAAMNHDPILGVLNQTLREEDSDGNQDPLEEENPEEEDEDIEHWGEEDLEQWEEERELGEAERGPMEEERSEMLEDEREWWEAERGPTEEELSERLEEERERAEAEREPMEEEHSEMLEHKLKLFPGIKIDSELDKAEAQANERANAQANARSNARTIDNAGGVD